MKKLWKKYKSLSILLSVLLLLTVIPPLIVMASQKPTTTESKEDQRISMNMKVGKKNFTVTLEDNKTAKALIKQLPLKVNMSELNGNEKYNYLESDLRADTPTCPQTIHKGDLMLYGNNCLVLFYESFQTSYSYVKIGHIENTKGLSKAVGSGDVKITFSTIEK